MAITSPQTDGSTGVTAALCGFLAEAAPRPLPVAIRREAERSLLNVVGTAVGAAYSDAADALFVAAARDNAIGSVPVLGRAETLPPLWAAVVTGVAAHYDDFDDTHLQTVIHPSAACLAALLAVGVPAGSGGEKALNAFALGCEAQLRIGVAMSPSHYDAGWHITGTCGVLGAAVTAGLLLDLDATRLEAAMGIAASLSLGLRDAFGTMTKPLHPGQASANGVLAARLAAAGHGAPSAVLEAEQGYLGAMAEEYDLTLIDQQLGEHWELASNSYKPYPCGIVSHPAIDAAIALSSRLDDLDQVRSITVHGHALVRELTGNPDPTDGLQAKFSTIHGVCAGLVDGRVGIPQYQDARVREADLIDLRARTTLITDPQMPRDAARIEVELSDGETISEKVEHARGSLARPLSDEELVDKVRGLVEPVLPDATDAIVAAVDALADSPDLTPLCRVATGAGAGDGR